MGWMCIRLRLDHDWPTELGSGWLDENNSGPQNVIFYNKTFWRWLTESGKLPFLSGRDDIWRLEQNNWHGKVFSSWWDEKVKLAKKSSAEQNTKNHYLNPGTFDDGKSVAHIRNLNDFHPWSWRFCPRLRLFNPVVPKGSASNVNFLTIWLHLRQLIFRSAGSRFYPAT